MLFMRGVALIILLVCLVVFAACSRHVDESEKINLVPQQTQKEVDTMNIISPEFENNKPIPAEFTCDDADISPPLYILSVPKNAQSLALIMDDPDAPMGTFVHWVVWNIPPNTTEIKKGEAIPWPQGRTDFGKRGYGGPCPPGGTHRYFFKLYAIDTKLSLPPGSTKRDVLKAIEGHIIAEAQLIGTYTR